MAIIIFCGPVRSGKTSALLDWSKRQKNIAGILMPDINGSRKILDLQTKSVFDIECTDAENTNQPLITVGRFHFYTAAFEKANSIIMNALTENPGWLVIDESGKLELEGKGFYTSIIKALEFYKRDKTPGNLLITVRENLCAETISFFKITGYRIINNLNELT